MKQQKERLLYAVLVVLFVGYVVIEQYKPKPIDWTPTFSQKDKNPYGAYILYERLEDLFSMGKKLSFETLYEQRDSMAQTLILTLRFEGGGEDLQSIFQKLEQGNDVFIGSSFFGDRFLDTLGVEGGEWLSSLTSELGDSIDITFGRSKVNYPPSIASSTLLPRDSTNWEVLAKAGDPVLIKKKIGGGTLVLCSTPLAFTNYGMLHDNGQEYVEMALKELRDGELVYNRFYHSGRGESSTPLRYLISQAPLKWALYLTVFGLLILLTLGSRRKQRAIPLVDAKANTTVQFIQTMGGLYFREGNHKNAGEKLISHFLKTLSEKYYISHVFSEDTYSTLASKTGLNTTAVVDTFELILLVRNAQQISEETLIALNEKIAQFNLT